MISIGIVLFVSFILFTFDLIYQKSNKQDFIKECLYCHSKNISHNKPIYKYIENFVISSISKPIAHFDVKYHCNDCNKTFYKELEIDLLLQENHNKFKIEYKE